MEVCPKNEAMDEGENLGRHEKSGQPPSKYVQSGLGTMMRHQEWKTAGLDRQKIDEERRIVGLESQRTHEERRKQTRRCTTNADRHQK